MTTYTKAIGINPKAFRLYFNRGRSYLEQSDYDRAISDFTRFIENDPYDASSYYDRGVACEKKGKLDCAIDDYHKALELDPRHDKAKTSLDRLER